VGDHLLLRLADGRWLVLWRDDDGLLRMAVNDEAGERLWPEDVGGLVVSDDLGLARLAVWAKDQLRRQ
jgi:hypothetical protein